VLDTDLFSTFSDASFAALGHLQSWPWFYRAWIIQEVISGKHQAMVHCGKVGWRWSHFINAINSLAQRGLISRIQEKAGSTKGVLRQLELSQNVESREMDIMPLVSMARAAEATDPRHKIYALLSLAKGADDLRVATEEGRIRLRVDYTQPVRVVYVAAAKAMIISSGLQGIFSQAWGIGPSVYYLPSWVPDWHVPRKGVGIDRETWHLDKERSKNRWSRSIDSSGGSQQTCFNASWNYGSAVFGKDETLKVQGVQFDTLKD